MGCSAACLKGTGVIDADVHVLTQQRHVVTSSGQTSPGFTREPLYMHCSHARGSEETVLPGTLRSSKDLPDSR